VFAERGTKVEIESGSVLMPKFDEHGLIPAVTSDYLSGELLMVAFMNAESLTKTLQLGEAVYWSRSRKELWHKGSTSGQIQKIVEIRIDCDQDCLWLRVDQLGVGACHTGHRSCFYRTISPGEEHPLIIAG